MRDQSKIWGKLSSYSHFNSVLLILFILLIFLMQEKHLSSSNVTIYLPTEYGTTARFLLLDGGVYADMRIIQATWWGLVSQYA